jgi:hypothetical protein
MQKRIHNICQDFLTNKILEQEFTLLFLTSFIELSVEDKKQVALAVRDLYMVDGEG